MSRSEDIKSFYSQQLVMAPNATMALGATAGQCALSIKLLAGGTLEVGGQSQTIGTMYPMSANEIVSAGASGTIWLYASSATCTVAVLRGLTMQDT